jgi:hypothetical protein
MEEGEFSEKVGLNGEIEFSGEIDLSGEVLLTIATVLKEKLDVLAQELETVTDMIIAKQ